jgi:hypothetical protein
MEGLSLLVEMGVGFARNSDGKMVGRQKVSELSRVVVRDGSSCGGLQKFRVDCSS